MRRERMERIRREASRSLTNALALNQNAVHPFNPAMPWDHCFIAAINDDKYWSEHVNTPCLQICTKIKHIGGFIEGDAQIGDSAAPSSSHVPPPPARHPTPRLTNAQKKQQKALRQQQQPAASQQVEPPYPTQQAPETCNKYNAGNCPGENCMCPVAPHRRHACSQCGRNHPMIRCNKGKAGDQKKGAGKGGKGGKGGKNWKTVKKKP